MKEKRHVLFETKVDFGNFTPTKDQVTRRAKSEEVCKQREIPFYQNPHSLFTPSEAETVLPSKDAVVDRAIALLFIENLSELGGGWKINQDNAQHFKAFNEQYGAIAKLSPAERKLYEDDAPDEQSLINANWRAECYRVLLWALGYLEADAVLLANEPCNIADDSTCLFTRSEEEFRSEAKLRDKAEILDAADLFLRFEWACVEARINGEEPSGGLDPGVVMERFYALNWLIYGDDWDSVRTDT